MLDASQKNFYLIAGPNGSGKTTLGRELIKEEKIEFLNADDIAACQHVSIIHAGRILLQKIDRVLSENKSFAWETTLSGVMHRNVIARALANNYKLIFLYVFLASAEQNVARIAQRVALGGHYVDSDVVRRRIMRSILNFEEVYKVAHQWELYYNGSMQYELIAHGIKENMIVENSRIYGSFKAKQAQILSKKLLDLANRGAKKAQDAAAAAGMAVEYRDLHLR